VLIAPELEAIMEVVREGLSRRHAAREQALTLCREVIRNSANAIRAVHRSEFDTAVVLIDKARTKTAEVNRLLHDFPEIYHSGFVSDAQKEPAEASLTLALVCGDPLPSPAGLEMAEAPFLNGLGEAVGELRRHALDLLRTGAVEESERYLQAMDDIYAVLVTVDFPDALTGGLRRTTDVTRGILEKTRADLTLAAQQYALERRIKTFEQRLDAEMSIEAKTSQP
jgi:translin